MNTEPTNPSLASYLADYHDTPFTVLRTRRAIAALTPLESPGRISEVRAELVDSGRLPYDPTSRTYSLPTAETGV